MRQRGKEIQSESGVSGCAPGTPERYLPAVEKRASRLSAAYCAREAKPESSRLGAILVQRGLVTAEELHAAAALAQESDGFLGQALIDLGFIKEEELTTFLAKEGKIPHLSLLDYEIQKEVVGLLPRDLCLRKRILPVDQLGHNLTLAMVDPLDTEALELVHEACPDVRLKPILCTNAHFETAVAHYLSPQKEEKASKGDVTAQSFGLGTAPRKKPAKAPAAPAPESVEEDVGATLRTVPAVQAPPGPKSYRIALVCLDGWEIGREVELTAEQHIFGRSPTADTVLDSKLVSREHAKIVRSEEYGGAHFVLTDLNSSNGTLVNNVPVSSTALHNGDKIQMGDILFKFLIQDEAEARFHRDVHRLIHYHNRTGLLTNEAFLRHFAAEIQKAGPGQTISIAMTGMDGLKKVNDHYGHIAGSAVLSDMGELIRRSLRTKDCAGMYGGDQAILLFPGTPLDAAFALAEDLRRTFEAHVFKHKAQRFSVTISVGLAEWPRHGSTVEEIIGKAEEACNAAKAQGRNCTCVAEG